MRRIVFAAAVLAAAIAPHAPARATTTAGNACHARLAHSLDWGSHPVESADPRAGSSPVDLSAALGTTAMQWRYVEYCQQGGGMPYRQYVHAFLRTSGFYHFSQSPEGALRRLAQEAAQGMPTPAEARILPTHAPATRSFHRPVSQQFDRQILRLPELSPGVLYVHPSEPVAYVMQGRHVHVLWRGQWHGFQEAD